MLTSPATYRAGAFLGAARKLGLEVVQAIDMPEPLAEHWGVDLALDFTQPEIAAAHLAERFRADPPAAILAVDDAATLVAALASDRLGLPHNDPAAALAARDKSVMRERLAAAGIPVPTFRRWALTTDPELVARESVYPCVVKPLRLSGSRGVIRADAPADLVAAWRRSKALLLAEGNDPATSHLLVERFISGVEVALEGLLTDGRLQTLAIFDKPDPLDGPFFEETIYVTPSRLPTATQRAISAQAARAAAALGLRHGPVHAEFRINDEAVWPLELAGRSIGGLCASVLEFGVGIGLEEIILLNAVGQRPPTIERTDAAAGVMMIPIPKAGMLREVTGVEAAAAVPGVTGVEITAKLNHPLVPLPEGASYLGFIFARADEPAKAEAALRDAHRQLRFRIEPTISLHLAR